MKIRFKSLPVCVAVSLFLTACASSSIDPRSLKSAAELAPLKIQKSTNLVHYENSRISTFYTLAKGQYLPIFQDGLGVFYICPTGVVVSSVSKATGGDAPNYLRLTGGVYIPLSEIEKPRAWILEAAQAAISGKIKLSESEATMLRDECGGDTTQLPSVSTNNSVSVVVVSNDLSARGQSLNLASGALSTVLVNKIISANDGKIIFPELPNKTDIPIGR